MSTKNLSKTVIEGGRTGYSKYERRQSNKELRAKVREYMININKDIEFAYEEAEPERKKVYKDFDDKLSPMYRWLHKQVGRSWNAVKSEVCQLFDDRTTAGRHILYDHLLRSVEETPDLRFHKYYYGPDLLTESYGRDDFYVDEDGLLQNKVCIRRRKYRSLYNYDTSKIAEWLNGRIVGSIGKKLYWFIPNSTSSWSDEWKCEWNYSGYRYGLRYMYKTYVPVYRESKVISYEPNWREPYYYKYKKIGARQYKELSSQDMVFWNSIPESFQKQILEWSPLNENPPKAW